MTKGRLKDSDLPEIMELLKTKPFGETGMLFGYPNRRSGYQGIVILLKKHGLDPRQHRKKSGNFKKDNKFGDRFKSHIETDSRPNLIQTYMEGSYLIRVYEARYALGIF